MVLGRLPLYGELEASPDCSQASGLSAEEIVVVYHERTKVVRDKVHLRQAFQKTHPPGGYRDAEKWDSDARGHRQRPGSQPAKPSLIGLMVERLRLALKILGSSSGPST